MMDDELAFEGFTGRRSGRRLPARPESEAKRSEPSFHRKPEAIRSMAVMPPSVAPLDASVEAALAEDDGLAMPWAQVKAAPAPVEVARRAAKEGENVKEAWKQAFARVGVDYLWADERSAFRCLGFIDSNVIMFTVKLTRVLASHGASLRRTKGDTLRWRKLRRQLFAALPSKMQPDTFRPVYTPSPLAKPEGVDHVKMMNTAVELLKSPLAPVIQEAAAIVSQVVANCSDKSKSSHEEAWTQLLHAVHNSLVRLMDSIHCYKDCYVGKKLGRSTTTATSMSVLVNALANLLEVGVKFPTALDATVKSGLQSLSRRVEIAIQNTRPAKAQDAAAIAKREQLNPDFVDASIVIVDLEVQPAPMSGRDACLSLLAQRVLRDCARCINRL